MLAEYRWGTGTARHFFCARCGISPCYVPRSNPNGWGVTFHCLEGGTVSSVDVKYFDGIHWEDFIEGSGIQGFSDSADGGGSNKAEGGADDDDSVNADDDDAPPSSAALSIAWSVLDVIGTLLLPLVLIVVVSMRSGKMPGKAQADIGMMAHGEMLKYMHIH